MVKSGSSSKASFDVNLEQHSLWTNVQIFR